LSALVFPEQEYEHRLGRIRAKMQAAGLDALILTRGENIFYASGFKASHFASWLSEIHALVIPRDGAPRLLTRALERQMAERQWTASPCLHMDHQDPYPLLRAILKESGTEAKRVGIEERFLKISQFGRLRQCLPQATFADASGLVEGVAASPSEAETNCMREAARITEVGFSAGVDAVNEGTHVHEVIGKIHYAMYAAGQRDFDMSLVCIWAGPEGGRMHDTSTTHKLANGDIATVEVWGVDNHYKAGAQGSIYIGSHPPREIVEAYDLVARMHANATNAVRAGAATGEVFDAASAVYRAARGSDYYRRCGGSMGLTVFTLDLVRGSRDVLAPGVSLLIQTLVDDPVLLTCASTVMVTADGCDELTQPLIGLKTTG
jgi:Xaa-Pro aminopeptidase